DAALVVKVTLENLAEHTAKEKKQDLMDILQGTKVNTSRQPSKMWIKGKPFFCVRVSNQIELDALLGGTVDLVLSEDDDTSEIEEDDNQPEMENGHSDRSVATKHVFERIDLAAERKHDMARSTELYGLPAKVNMELLRLAANQFGDVEDIKLRACTRRVKMIATIHYEDNKFVEDMQQHEVRHFEV
ncbi:hypothetical protein BGX31_003661, partial [Mortierella sp. GBA43]